MSVQLSFEAPHQKQRVSLPGWTPGSYLIRDYVKQLEGLKAHQHGQPLSITRTDPASWCLEADPAGGPVTITYAVMATELTVRTCHLDQDHGFLALAAVVLEVEGKRWHPHQLRCHLPQNWSCLLYTSPSPRDATLSRMPSSA